MLNNIERGDTVVIKTIEGITKTVTVLSVKIDYNNPGSFLRFDYVDNSSPSPMRATAWPKELMSIVKKSAVKALDPKAPRPGDSAHPQNAVVLNGKVYVERSAQATPVVPLNADADNKEVHVAATTPAKPVTERIKKVKKI